MRDKVTAEPDMILTWTLNVPAAFLSHQDLHKSRDCYVIIMKNHKLWGVCLWSNLSHPVHVFGAGIGSKHREDPRAATNIQDNFIFEHVLVVVHGVPVGQRPHLVFQHLLFKLEIKLRVHSCDKIIFTVLNDTKPL